MFVCILLCCSPPMMLQVYNVRSLADVDSTPGMPTVAALTTVSAHRAAISSLQILSTDDQMVLSAASDHCVKIWAINFESRADGVLACDWQLIRSVPSPNDAASRTPMCCAVWNPLFVITSAMSLATGAALASTKADDAQCSLKVLCVVWWCGIFCVECHHCEYCHVWSASCRVTELNA